MEIQNEKKLITIFSRARARQLMRNGFVMYDVKPDALDETKQRTVFVFEYDRKIYDVLNSTPEYEEHRYHTLCEKNS